MPDQTQQTQEDVSSKRITFTGLDIRVKDLLLDPNNYRFLDNPSYKRKIKTKFHLSAVQNTTLRLLEQDKRYQLTELKKSILTNGYVPMERIIVVPYKYSSGKYMVVEGNRRIAALKSLIQEFEEGVRELTPAEIKSFSKIPCAVLKAPRGSLKHAERVIMGIRHIAGPKEWGAYQQAKLISEMHDEEGEDFTGIGEHLGISAIEASRRYRALLALKGMEEDELYSESASPEFYRLFHELVASPEVRKRFGWDDAADGFSDIEKAREFFELIAPQNGNDAKLKTFSDVRKLKLVVGRPKAEAVLLDPDRSFTDSLKLADAEIEDELAQELAVGELCRDMRSQLQALKVSKLEEATQTDLSAVVQLVNAAKALKKALERHLGVTNEPPATRE